VALVASLAVVLALLTVRAAVFLVAVALVLVAVADLRVVVRLRVAAAFRPLISLLLAIVSILAPVGPWNFIQPRHFDRTYVCKP
jgi:hypothetical protein